MSTKQRDKNILRRNAALNLLYLLAACPRRWFFPVDSISPRMQSPLFPLPAPSSRPAVWLENAAGLTFTATLLVLLVIPWSKRVRPVSLLAAVGYAIMASFDATRVKPGVLHPLGLLFIGSCCKNDGMTAARILASGTWLWSGIHKINPRFLKNFQTIADPFFAAGLGSSFVERHRVLLHLLAAVMEAGAGLVLLLNSGTPKPRKTVGMNVLMVRASAIFLGSMHIMIIVRFIQLKWGYSVIGWNLHCLFLAAWLWHPWWRNQPKTRNQQSKGGDGLAVAVPVVTAIFVLLPVLLVFGLIDPDVGLSTYSENVNSLMLELPAGGADLYRHWGFLNETPGWNSPLIPALTHDGRSVYSRDYIMLNAAASGGHGGYWGKWAFMQYTSTICEQIRTADVSAVDSGAPSIVDDARFFLQLPYTGSTLFWSLWNMAFPIDAPLPQRLLLIREGCRLESEDVWRPFQVPETNENSDMREIIVSVTAPSDAATKPMPPVDIYWVGTTKSNVRPDLVHIRQTSQDEAPFGINAWVGGFFMAAWGGNGKSVPIFSPAPDLCALEVWVVTRSESGTQNLVLDLSRGNLDKRTVPGVPACSFQREVEFIDGANRSIEIAAVDEEEDEGDLENDEKAGTSVREDPRDEL